MRESNPNVYTLGSLERAEQIGEGANHAVSRCGSVSERCSEAVRHRLGCRRVALGTDSGSLFANRPETTA